MADLQRQCHQSVEVVVGWRCLLPLSIHMLYDDIATWRVWAAKKGHQPPLPCGQVLNQRLGEGHPDRKPRRAVVWGRMRSKLRERPAVYPAFALRATRGSSSLEDQTSSFSTHEYTVLETSLGSEPPCGGWCRRMALRNPELHARNDNDICYWYKLQSIVWSQYKFLCINTFSTRDVLTHLK